MAKDDLYPKGSKFPIGLYSISLEAEMTTEAANKVNLVHEYNMTTGFLSKAANTDMNVLAKLSFALNASNQKIAESDSAMNAHIDSYLAATGNANIAWWDCPEELRYWFTTTEMDLMSKWYAKVRDRDPQQRPFYHYIASHYGAEHIAPYADRQDIFGIPIYISDNSSDMAFARYKIEAAVNALQGAGKTLGKNYLAGEKTIVAIMECFDTPRNTNILTAAKVYHNFWQALVSGAKGILVFSYFHRNDSVNYQGVYTQLTQAFGELRGSEKLDDVVLYGQEVPITFNITSGATVTDAIQPYGIAAPITYPALDVKGWRYQNHLYIIAVNSANASTTADISGFTTGAASASVLFEARSETITANTITDTWGAYEKHIYKIAMNLLNTTKSGNWSDTTVFDSGTSPQKGENLAIGAGHAVVVDVDADVGASPGAGAPTPAISIASGGSLTVAAGVTLRVRGDIKLTNATLTLERGASLIFDNSEAVTPATAKYVLEIGTGHNQGSLLKTNGTPTQRCSISTVTGGGYAAFTGGAYLRGGQIDLTYTNVTRVGDASVPMLDCGPSAAGNKVVANNCIFDTCGKISTSANLSGDAIFNLEFCTWKNTADADYCLTVFNPYAIGTGTRALRSCVLDKDYQLLSAKDFTIQGCFVSGVGSVSAGAWALHENNMYVFGAPGDKAMVGSSRGNIYISTSASNPHGIQLTGEGNLTIEDEIFYYDGTNNEGDAITLYTVGTPSTYTIRRFLNLPNAGGECSGTLFSALGNANCTLIVENCTSFIGSQGAAVGETYAGHAGMISSFKNNLLWDTSARGYKLYDSVTNESVPDLATSAAVDYNCGWRFLTGSNGKGYNNLEFSSGSPGAHDIEVDPQFVDSSRNPRTFDTRNGGNGTLANLVAELKKANDATGWNPSYSIAALIAYIREGFAPQNQALKNAGYGGVDIGAIAVATSSSGTVDPITPVVVGPIPGKSQWLSRMRDHGLALSLKLADPAVVEDVKQAAIYYDSEFCFYKAYDALQDGSFLVAASRAETVYKAQMDAARTWGTNLPGALPGYNVFPKGLAEDYLRTGDTDSRDRVSQLATNSSYGGTIANSTARAELQTNGLTREAAYLLNAYVQAYRCGLALSQHTAFVRDCLFLHFDQWFISRTADFVAPFMAALSSMALIDYCRYADSSYTTQVKNLLAIAWEFLWVNAYNPTHGVFPYHYNISGVSDSVWTWEEQRDLNLLMVAPFGWLYHQTGDKKWADRGDALFEVGVTAWLGDPTAASVRGKQYNQSYLYSHDYVYWREATPLVAAVPPPTPGSNNTPPPSYQPPSTPTLPPAISPVTKVGPNSAAISDDSPDGAFATANATGVKSPGRPYLIETGAQQPIIFAVGTDTNHTKRVVIHGETGAVSSQGGFDIAKVSSDLASGGCFGAATLVAGSYFVAYPSVTANSIVFVSRLTNGGTPGDLTVEITQGNGFTIRSSSATDTSKVAYFVVTKNGEVAE